MNPAQTPLLKINSGSFRDPAGFVFIHRDQVYRAVSEEHWPLWIDLKDTGLLDELIKAHELISTEAVAAGSDEHESLAVLCPGFRHFLKHEKIAWISYPAEWCFSMLAEAGLLHLRLQEKLLARDFSLKDASAFNVQFIHTRPVFIDLLSIEKPPRLDVWMAYGQFCRMFLFPLLLYWHRKIGFREIFGASLDGLDVDRAYAMLGAWRSLRPELFLDVFLQRALGQSSGTATTLKQQPVNRDANAQLLNLRRLSAKIKKSCRRNAASSHWATYESMHNYTDEAKSEKSRFIGDFMSEHKPGTVLDLGCNTGSYSVLAAERGAKVVAIDSDHDCVEHLYRLARERGLHILPLVVDIANPTPATGFRNQERPSFLQRYSADCVFALALIHHLLVACRLPMAAICDLMADLTNQWLVIEFVEREDSMFQKLLALREDLYGGLMVESFEREFARRFEPVRRMPLPGTRRHLFVYRKKT